MSYILAFVVMLGGLIFVHEFGHFLVAKLCGVRVLKFSLGFGSPIGFGRARLAFRWGETEYVVAWFPLGGFVKMLGENPDEEDGPEAGDDPDRAFNRKPIWQRLAIVVAGPAMNFLLPIVVFAGALSLGMPRPAPVVGMVEVGSPAEEVGLRPGDRMLSIDGAPVRWWDDVEERIRSQREGSLALEVEHQGERRAAHVRVVPRSGLDVFGGAQSVGWIGVGHARLRPVLGVPSGASPAAQAGLHSGDVVLTVNGEPVEDWGELAERYARAAGSPVRLSVFRPTVAEGESSEEMKLAVTLPVRGDLRAVGIVPATVLIDHVSPDSPAERAGLRAGDLLVAVDGRPVGSFATFAETVRASEGRRLRITLAREGVGREVVVTPELVENEQELGVPRYLIGIQARAETLPGKTLIDRELNPLRTLPRAVGMTADLTRTFLLGFWKIVSGGVSARQLAGPIGIAEIAHDAWQAGWEVFVSRLVLISINLAILNLLPIPVLDGGQAFLLLIEGIKRSPVSMRARLVAQQIGLTALVLLMGLALWNDLARRWDDLLEWVRHSTGL